MYVRKKTAKGNTYYQIVQGVRDGERVRQRIVMALGSTPDPRVGLKNMKRELAGLRRERKRLRPTVIEGSKMLTRRAERLDIRIGDLQDKINTLTGIIKNKLIGTTAKRKDD